MSVRGPYDKRSKPTWSDMARHELLLAINVAIDRTGMSNGQVAAKLGWHVSHVADLRNLAEGRSWGPDRLHYAAEVFGVDVPATYARAILREAA